VPDVLDHPHPLTVELARPLQQLTEPLTPSSDRPLRDLHPERVDPDPRCASACVDRPRSSTSRSVPSSNDPMKRTSRRTLFSQGSAKLLSSHARTSLTATSDTIGEGQPTGRPNQGKSARSRQGQSTTRANKATPNQLLTEIAGLARPRAISARCIRNSAGPASAGVRISASRRRWLLDAYTGCAAPVAASHRQRARAGPARGGSYHAGAQATRWPSAGVKAQVRGAWSAPVRPRRCGLPPLR
jgi:hypothetical protein